MKTLKYLSLLFLISSCSPKVIIKSLQTQNYQPVQDYEPFVAFTDLDTINLDKEQVIADIQIKDAGLTINCDFETILDLAKERSKALGANALQVYEHRLPDAWSSCHRIRCRALRMRTVKPYEKEISWNKKRKLAINDFKGSRFNRPFAAATVSGMNYKAWGRPIRGYATLSVNTVFDCTISYIKNNPDSLKVLAHEQLHFDITELFARKFVKRIQNEVRSFRELQISGERVFKEVQQEWRLLQDAYDTEVYADRSQQPKWIGTIAEELQKMSQYENRQAKIKW